MLDALGSILGVSGGSLVAPIFSAASGILGMSNARSRQEDSQAFSASQFANRYQTTVEDMKKAGLNPMLAYSQGGGNAPTSSPISSPMPDVGASLTQSKIASAQIANIEADTVNKTAQSKLIEAQTVDHLASANQKDAGVTKIGQEVQNLKEQFKNIPLEGARLKAFAENLAHSSGLLIQQGMTQEQVRDHLRAMVSKLNSETELLDLDIDAAKSLDNIGREYRQLQPIVDLIRSFIRK